MTQNNLANAYSERIRSDRAENIKQAIKHYEEALKVYTQKDFPILCQKTACNLGNLCLDVQRFSEAERAYTMGMEAAEELTDPLSFKPAGRWSWQRRETYTAGWP